MKLMLANGAYQNSGDYLIRDSFERFFHKHFRGTIDLIKYDEIDQIENTKIILGGGPIFEKRFQNKLQKSISLNNRLVCFGAGSYVMNYSKEYSQLPINIDHKLANISTRDILTREIFNLDVPVTGCAASYFNSKASTLNSHDEVAVSVPQRYGYFTFTYSLLNMLVSMGIQPTVFFNRGWEANSHTSGLTQKLTSNFAKKLEKDGYKVVDASGADGMEKYDRFATHIGFRLHSHYYFLQRGLKSLLLEEDSRGRGSNLLFKLNSFQPAKFKFNVTKLNVINPTLAAICFRTMDALNLHSDVNKEHAKIIRNFLENDFPENRVRTLQEQLEAQGSKFINETLNA